MSDAKLIVIEGEEVLEFEELQIEDPIKEKCQDAGIPFACEEGICGTCIIEVVEGEECLSDYNEAEEDFLGPKGKERLACQCRIKKKGIIKIRY